MARECRWGAFLLSLAAACGNSAPPTSPSGGPSEQALTVTVTGAGAVVSTPGGINCDEGESQRRGPACSASFAQGTSVALAATAAGGSLFAGWDGACTGQGACTVTMSAAASVTARFTAAPPPPPPPPTATFAVTVATHGSGAVRSDPAGLDCGQTCAATFAAGTAVKLSASPAAGFKFSAWSGACAGAQECTLTSDANVAAQFDQLPPPPPGTRSLSVTAQGQGSVSSSPAGISCDGGESQRRGSTCNATFSDGAQVQLTATPASGWQFSGFSGACSGQSCSVTMSADRSVSAAFTQIPPPPPPPPVDKCAGLVPGSLGTAAYVTLPQEPCQGGTTDDGKGTFVLEWTAGGDHSFPGYAFFTVQNGNAVEIGQHRYGSDAGASFVFSQPSGFTQYSSGAYERSGLSNYSHEGVFTSGTQLTTMNLNAQGTAAGVGVDPSGGTVAVVSAKRTGPGWDNTFKRFDRYGTLESSVAIDDAELKQIYTFSSVGIDLAGHALVIANDTAASRTVARWFDHSSAPLTGWFPALAADEFNFLVDGSLVTRGGPSAMPSAGPSPTNHVIARYPDAQSSAVAPPDWLQARAANRLYVIRKGKGYASWGAGGSCGGALEVLAASGKSCGCVNVPELSPYSTVGRDGSLIVPADGPAPSCHYRLYPQLLK